MPRPNKDEERKEFLQRCMDSEEAKRDFPDTDQRYAVCNKFWKEGKTTRGKSK